MNNLQELRALVVTWAEEKGLLKDVTPQRIQRQTEKFFEELGETAGAYLRGNREELKDGIGDTAVTIIILAEMRKETIDLTIDLPAVIDQKLILISNLISEYFMHDLHRHAPFGKAFSCAILELDLFAAHNGFTLQECLQSAYDVISKRKGSMIGDTFIKEDKIVALYSEEQLKQAQFAYYTDFDNHPENYAENGSGDRENDASDVIDKLLSFVQPN